MYLAFSQFRLNIAGRNEGSWRRPVIMLPGSFPECQFGETRAQAITNSLYV
jgi:hypothetical protein